MIKLLVLGLAGALATLAAPQFRASVDAVRVEALVLDRNRPVAGLTASDLRLTDNGVPQTIAVRAIARQPIDVTIALDTSDSVRGARLERLRAAALALVGQLQPDDRATLATFQHLVFVGPRDAAPAALTSRIAGLREGGGTALVDATVAALVDSLQRERPMLILAFSDGRDTASWTRGGQALELARASDAVVDAVVTRDMLPTNARRVRVDNFIEPMPQDERFLLDLTAQTGGHIRDGEAGGGLAGAFAAAVAQFRTRYEITYTPTNKESGWHAIEIRVPGRRGLAVHARRGYQR
jgi:VWFA-related protein